MTDRLQAIRGMNDILPREAGLWRWLEQQFIECVTQYNYQEIRCPLVESTQLFKRTIGEATDVVEKEMYTFVDLNGETISLRPEGTAGIVRACLEHGLIYNQQQRLWYSGPMFRHEKPQKGRFRQFHHLGVEVFGIAGPFIELELLALSQRFWKQLNIDAVLRLEINTLGTAEERQAYREHLMAYFIKHQDSLDEDSQRRLTRNPLRILDSKNPAMQALITQAPILFDHLGEESRQHFEVLCQGLTALDLPYTINPRLVRGLDYYGQTIFEWVTDHFDAPLTVCGGGRYDALVAQLGGQATPAVGFGIGEERVLLLLQAARAPVLHAPDIFMIVEQRVDVIAAALKLAETIRLTHALTVAVHLSGGGFKKQFKKADQSGAVLALILGVEEFENQHVGFKRLRATEPQQTYHYDELMQQLKQMRLNTCQPM